MTVEEVEETVDIETESEIEVSYLCENCGKEITEENMKKHNNQLFCAECYEKIKEYLNKDGDYFRGDLKIEKNHWIKVLKITKKIIEEPIFRVKGNTVTIHQMDNKHISMIHAEMKHKQTVDAFDEEKTFSVNLPMFFNALKRSTKLNPTIKIDDTYVYINNYRMRLLEVYNKEVPNPKLDSNITAKIDAGEIFSKTKWFYNEPDHIKLIAEKGQLYIEIENDEGEYLKEKLCKCVGEGEAIYTKSYLELLKGQRYSSDWDIDFQTGMPLHAKWEYEYGSDDYDFEVDLWIAPLVGV